MELSMGFVFRTWLWDQVLPQHPNGMRFSVFDAQGDMLATNTYFSIGGGFVVNEETQGSLCPTPTLSGISTVC
jgi:hypothetical protein